MKRLKVDLLWAAAIWMAAVVLLLLPAQAVRGQCVGGLCKQPAPNVDVWVNVRNRQPTRAWRYERAIGHRQAVVRIHCIDREVGNRVEWSKGSGVLVRWGKRIVVLTARHVVKDAKRIIVELFTKKTHWATVLSVDATWDCAVLQLTGQPEGVEPAEIEFGPTATAQDGDRLESAGYGPDGKLAVNVGVFQGFRRSTQANDGRDDWMVISGHARGGDSGGPVFNQRGRVVGILWGTDGETVVCVQAGRVHATIDAAMKAYRQNSTEARPLVPVVFPQKRNPTPPMSGPGVDVGVGVGVGKAPMLPWRGEQENQNASQDARIGRILDAMERQQQQPQPPVVTMPSQAPVIEPAKEEEPTTLGIGLCLAGALATGIGLFYVVGKG